MRILEITSALDGGGVDRLLYDYCSALKNDFQFDFIVTSKSEGMLEKPLRDIGCNIYRIPQIRENFKAHCEKLKEILESNKYDVIHDHSGFKAWCNLHVAKRCGVPVRIAHSHQAYMTESIKQKIERKLSEPITEFFATDLFACGNEAAKWMWGEKTFKRGKVYVMKNAINAESFDFSLQKRNDVRKSLNIEDKFVIGNVARFSFQKNHEFLIRVFKDITKIRNDAVLLLIGRGETENEIKALVQELHLEDSVIFTGVRNDVPELLNAMDVFVLPSRFEGLPVTLVEIQANGLPAVVSDSITKELSFSDKISFIPLSAPTCEWAQTISEKQRDKSENRITGTDYDLKTATNELKNKYLSLRGKTST